MSDQSMLRCMVGLVGSLLIAFPFFWFGSFLITPRGTYVINASGICFTGRTYFWQPKESTLIPWHRVYKIYIDDRKNPPAICASAVLVADDGSLYKQKLEFWNWQGDWEKAVYIIMCSISPESVLKAEEWCPDEPRKRR